MECVHVATFVNAELEIRQRRKDAKPETKRVMAALKDATDAAMGAMLAAGRSVVRVNGSTWVVLVEKRGAFPKWSVDALTETLKCMDQVDHTGAAGGMAGGMAGVTGVGVGVRDYVRKSLSYRGDGTASLAVQHHPPSGAVKDIADVNDVMDVADDAFDAFGEADADGCLSAAAAYVDALCARNVHTDRLRVQCAPAMLRRSDTESAAIEYVAPNGGDVDAPVSRVELRGVHGDVNGGVREVEVCTEV